MPTYTAKKFNIGTLKGISAKNIEEHLKLYEGYVKNANTIEQKMAEYGKDVEANSYVLTELSRRLSFEYNGIRNHEVYFASLEGGAKPLKDGALKKKIAETYGSFDAWVTGFKKLATTTRGIGWAVLWLDPRSGDLLTTWVDEQHYGHLQGCKMILGLDMWEHSYVADYQPSGKKNYVEDFFANLNWEIIDHNFQSANRA